MYSREGGGFDQRKIYGNDFKENNFGITIFVALEGYKESLKLIEQELVPAIEVKLQRLQIMNLKRGNEGRVGERMVDYFNFVTKRQVPPIFYDSMLVSLYSFLEKSMIRLCSIASAKKELKLRDLSGNGIEKCSKYLKRVCGIDFRPIEEEWSIIKSYAELRNLFVHRPFATLDKKVDKSKIAKIQKLDNVDLIDEGDEFKVSINKVEPLLYFLEIQENFLHYLCYKRLDRNRGSLSGK